MFRMLGSFTLSWLGFALVASALGCAPEPKDATPEGALRAFLEAMDRSGHDSGAREEAYHLLAATTRERLDRRAELATSLARRRFEPWEMIAQGRYRLRFEGRAQDGLEAVVHGESAEVIVRGARGQEARVPMVREDGHWRIDLPIPEMRRRAEP
jgi:hypothetical protein